MPECLSSEISLFACKEVAVGVTRFLHFSVLHVGVTVATVSCVAPCFVYEQLCTILYTGMHSAEHEHVADGPVCMVQGLLMVWWRPAGRAEFAVGLPMRSCAPFSGY